MRSILALGTFAAMQKPSAKGPAEEGERDHLFVSYAWEDAALADWLVRKLTAAGYAVWCDRFKLLGGERWPRDIDRAIKTRTHRMLALLSHHSVDKPNPAKERQLGLAIAKERDEDFVIPLNVDDLKPTEIGWELSDVTWISFSNWATGLNQLQKLLAQIKTPKVLGSAGMPAAISTYSQQQFLDIKPEPVLSNCYEVLELPENIFLFRSSRQLAKVERYQLGLMWPFYTIADDVFAAFRPPDLSAGYPFELTELRSELLNLSGSLEGIAVPDIVSSLIKRELFQLCRDRGLLVARDKTAFFPPGLLANDKLPFVSYTGRRSNISVLGERKFGKGRMRYHLGTTFYVKRAPFKNRS